MALPASEKSATGLDANIAAMLAYFVVPALIFLLMKETSRFVRFHSMQAIAFGVATILIHIVMTVLFSVPFLGLLIIPVWMIVNLAIVVVWIICLVKAFQGEEFKLPVLGDIAMKQMDRI